MERVQTGPRPGIYPSHMGATIVVVQSILSAYTTPTMYLRYVGRRQVVHKANELTERGQVQEEQRYHERVAQGTLASVAIFRSWCSLSFSAQSRMECRYPLICSGDLFVDGKEYRRTPWSAILPPCTILRE